MPEKSISLSGVAKNIHLPVIEMEDTPADVDPKLIEPFTDPHMNRMVMFNTAYDSY